MGHFKSCVPPATGRQSCCILCRIRRYSKTCRQAFKSVYTIPGRWANRIAPRNYRLLPVVAITSSWQCSTKLCPFTAYSFIPNPTFPNTASRFYETGCRRHRLPSEKCGGFSQRFLDRDHTNHKNPAIPLFFLKGLFKVMNRIQNLLRIKGVFDEYCFFRPHRHSRRP